MAIASLTLGLIACLVIVNPFIFKELQSILHMREFDMMRISYIIVLVVCISGLTLGILSICLRRRRRMGIVGTVLNSIVIGVYSFFYFLVISVFEQNGL